MNYFYSFLGILISAIFVHNASCSSVKDDLRNQKKSGFKQERNQEKISHKHAEGNTKTKSFTTDVLQV